MCLLRKPGLGFYMLQIFRKPYWLSDSRVWFLVRATDRRGSSRNLLVTQRWWIKQGAMQASCPFSSNFSPCSLWKGWSQRTAWGTPRSPARCAPWSGCALGPSSSRSSGFTGAEHGSELWVAGLPQVASSWVPCFFLRKPPLNTARCFLWTWEVQPRSARASIWTPPEQLGSLTGWERQQWSDSAEVLSSGSLRL